MAHEVRRHRSVIGNGSGECIGAVALAIVIAAGALIFAAMPLRAQSVPGQTASASQSAAPQWQTDAGGTAQFAATSVKQDAAPPTPQNVVSNIPLGPQDSFSPASGLLNARNFPLAQYMVFAYKLTPDQFRSVQSQLPAWASNTRYDIQGRAPGTPTRDQFRLMMQALLADRFKLAIHFETRQLPVLALVLDKPGKMGPQLQKHPDDVACSTAPPTSNSGPPPTVAGGFPENCGAVTPVKPSAPGRLRIGARNVPLETFSTIITPQLTGVDKPVLDQTGLTGKFDFVIEFTPKISGPMPPGFQPDPTGPTFADALKQQLGLKLEPQTGPVESVLVDHVEAPAEN
jgi:uncharacterized protein (TIGR03435 family)